MSRIIVQSGKMPSSWMAEAGEQGNIPAEAARRQQGRRGGYTSSEGGGLGRQGEWAWAWVSAFHCSSICWGEHPSTESHTRPGGSGWGGGGSWMVWLSSMDLGDIVAAGVAHHAVKGDKIPVLPLV